MFIADLCSMVLKILSMAIRGEKLSPNWKRRSKLSLFLDDIILYIENMKDAAAAAAAGKLLQSCPTLCNPIDGSPPGSTVPGILQARMLEWVAISFSNERCYHRSKVNLVKFQDTKLIHRNLLHLYTIIMKDHKENLKKISHLLLHQKK